MKTMKWLALLLVVAMLFAAAGCGGPADAPDDGPDLQVAVLIPSSPTDGGWGQIGAEAAYAVAEHFGIPAVIVEAATADLMKAEAEALAAEGFDVIFGHGGQYATPFSEVAGDYPDTLFVTNGGNIVTDNLVPTEYTLEQLTYIQGAMAAHLTETGIVGLVIGGQFPAYTKTSRGFELGARSVDPDIEVLLGVTQDASDMNEGYELTLAQIQAGADIVWTNANQASQGSVTAARETDTRIFGTIKDIQGEAPEQTISTACSHYGDASISLIEQYLAGTIEARVYKFGVPEGGISWIWNESMKEQLPADVVALYDELLDKILSGEIHVPGEQEGWD